jgi:hypothetical protein
MARWHQFDDLAVLDDDATFRAIGENGQWIFDPDRVALVHGCSFSVGL